MVHSLRRRRCARAPRGGPARASDGARLCAPECVGGRCAISVANGLSTPWVGRWYFGVVLTRMCSHGAPCPDVLTSSLVVEGTHTLTASATHFHNDTSFQDVHSPTCKLYESSLASNLNDAVPCDVGSRQAYVSVPLTYVFTNFGRKIRRVAAV